MKNLKFLFLFTTILGLTFTSCSTAPDPIITVDSQVIDNLKNVVKQQQQLEQMQLLKLVVLYMEVQQITTVQVFLET